MTPADLRDRIERARVAATRNGVVDPYVLALAALADLAEQYLTASDAAEDAIFSGIEAGVAMRQFEIAGERLRHALGMLTTARLTAGIRAIGDDPPRGWEYGVHARLPAVVLSRESWWRRAWRWLWR